MITLAQAISGAERYIEAEIIAKIPGWQKWVVGAGVSRALSRAGDIFSELKEHPMIKMLAIIDPKTDEIDIDALYNEFTKQAQRGAVTFNVPLAGALTLTAADVDKIYQYIKNAGG